MNLPFLDWSGFLNSLLTGILIGAGAWLAHSAVKRIIVKAMQHSRKLNQGPRQRLQTIQSLLINLASYVIFFVAAVSILAEFGLDISAILASAGVLGLAIGFGAKDLVSDVVAGFFMLMEDQVHVGERITVAGLTGEVEHVGLRALKLRSDEGDIHFILNREVKTLTNHSRGDMLARVDLPVPSDIDLERTLLVLEEECLGLKSKIPHIQDGPEVLGVVQLSASEAVIRIQARTVNGEQEGVERELRKEMKKALDKAELVKLGSLS
ncbi:mechanosensitive ion channel family protein [Staphylospora marina]|uniref:mechanosensitive ion channel family protein n=1 Tax=Staphylospora marina TaxID=2490858 RepID=UPI000F5BC84D|nr:mechanosensitive ion channel family protein [Staphylospora marina]